LIVADVNLLLRVLQRFKRAAARQLLIARLHNEIGTDKTLLSGQNIKLRANVECS
jgi:hypothetical protein